MVKQRLVFPVSGVIGMWHWMRHHFMIFNAKTMKKYLLLILLSLVNFSSIIGQERCEPKSDLFSYAENMPTLITPCKELEDKLNEDIHLKDFDIKEGQQVVVYFIINCKGESLDYRILKYENEIFNKKFIECLKNIANWTPGYVNGKPVNVSYVIVFQIMNGRIKMLFDEKNNKKEQRKLKQMLDYNAKIANNHRR